MIKLIFTVIYIKDKKLKHKQISSYSAFLACEEFEELNPSAIVLEAGLGSINKEAWKRIKDKEKEIIEEALIARSKNEIRKSERD